MIRSDPCPTIAQLPLLPSPPMSLRLDWRDSGWLRYLLMLNIYWFLLLNLFNVLSKVHLWSYPSSKVLGMGSICLYRSLSQLKTSSYLQSHCKCGRFCSWTDGALYFFNAQMFTKSILHSFYIVLYGKYICCLPHNCLPGRLEVSRINIMRKCRISYISNQSLPMKDSILEFIWSHINFHFVIIYKLVSERYYPWVCLVSGQKT